VAPVEPEKPVALPFGDVSTGAWYNAAVSYVFENKLMNGTSETEFAPNGKTDRAMVVTILHRMAGLPAVTGGSTFTDVKAGAWYTNAVIWGAEEEIVKGYSDGRFGPADLVTREQLVTFLWRYAKHIGLDVSVGENTNILSYTDAEQIGSYAVAAMQWGCGAGIIEGKGEGTLDPKGYATRAEVATMIQRFEALAK